MDFQAGQNLRMTIDLYRNEEDYFQFEYFGIWQKVMELARIYEWEPTGTHEPPEWDGDEESEYWEGDYDLYSGEWVTAEDARGLASALERSLDDLPDNPMPNRVIETEIEEIDRDGDVSISFHIIEANKSLNLFEAFGGQYKSELIAFIHFARRGGFHIYSALA
jgi:hypothetical protein